MAAKAEPLFPEPNTARYGDNRRKRPLFLPNYLKVESQDNRLKGARQDKALEIILKWAQLESSGKLEKEKETTLEPEFLTQVFGQALGYTLFSDGKQQWNLKPKFFLNGGQADAAIGLFESGKNPSPLAVIEMKGPTVNVDRDKFNGRTTVQQCWDYLNALPQCPWGIVCNYVSFRLYHRNHTPRVYELFTLQDLRKEQEFLKFYYLLERGGLLPTTIGQTPRAETLLEKSNRRQREVGDELYNHYHDHRLRLIQHLSGQPHNKPLNTAIRIAQKLIDRIVFVAFCEDRGLLPQNSIYKAWKHVTPFHRVTNPKWQNFLDLFRSIDQGHEPTGISPYNGGLFREDHEVDNLQLDDDWTKFFKSIGEYDFAYEVNVDVLGHLFEKSINDIERVRLGALFASKAQDEVRPKMIKSAERKKGGIYYTPPEFTEFIANNTVAKIADEKLQAVAKHYGIDPAEIDRSEYNGELAQYALEAIAALRQVKVVDPACGSGHFLINAYDVLEQKYLDLVDVLAFYDAKQSDALRKTIPDFILHDNLFGVDLSPEAVEITQLALWLRSAQKGKTLADLSQNIICGNSLVTDPDVDPLAMDWQKVFRDVFSRQEAGFDCVIGNPPWERLNLKKREFFAFCAPHIIKTANAAQVRKLIDKLETENPALHSRYLQAKNSADTTIAYVRESGFYPLTAKGDINTYSVFAELAQTIVAPNGKVGLLVPSGIATDNTNKDFFAQLITSKALSGLYDFENKAPIFPDVHRSYKFSVLLFGGSHRKTSAADFVFFAHEMQEIKHDNRHVSLSTDDFKLLNPNTRTCPVFRSERDAELTKAIYRRVPVLLDQRRHEGGNPWGIRYMLMFHQSFDAAHFQHAKKLQQKGFRLHGNHWRKGKDIYLPLYEAKMLQAYDHRAASAVTDESKWGRQGQTIKTTHVEHQNPEYVVQPRWWVGEAEVLHRLGEFDRSKILAFKNVTSPTNQRTMIISFIPLCGVIHSAPLMLTGPEISARLTACLLGNLNSLVYDFVCRQKIGGVNLSYFIINQIATITPDAYNARSPWNKRQTLQKWISERVLKLTCTSNDMNALAEAATFDPPVHKWNPSERLDLQAQLDAAFFLLYGIQREDAEYILSTFSGVRKQTEDMFDGSTAVDRILKHYDELRAKSK
ncbi:MAG: Eco57I restriction-modification methylase domain-containing protein [Planctomycetota bacterium]